MKIVSTIFETYYEFDSDHERDMYIIERKAELELEKIFRQMDICVLMEAGKSTKANDDEEYKGIIGLIKKGLHTIASMVGSLIEKIKSIFTGKERDGDVDFKQNPKTLATLCDKYVTDDIGLLPKVASGKVGLDEVKKIVGDHKEELAAVAPFAGAVTSLGLTAFLDRYPLKSWKSKLDQAYSRCGDEMTDYASQYARSKHLDTQREIIKEATTLLMKDIQTNSSAGMNAINSWITKTVIKREVGRRIRDEASSMDSTLGGAKRRLGKKIDVIADNIEAARLKHRKNAVETNAAKNKEQNIKSADARQNKADAESDFYIDSPKKNYTNQ